SAQPAQRSEPPRLVLGRGHLECVHIERCEDLALVDRWGLRPGGFGDILDGHQPPAPSICTSIRRFNSRAYSIATSSALRPTKPRTTVAIASSSVRPRLIR